MVPGTCLALNIKKGNTGSFSMIKIGLMLWIKSGIENPLKSEVIGCCGGDEKNEMTMQNRQKSNAKKVNKRRF